MREGSRTNLFLRSGYLASIVDSSMNWMSVGLSQLLDPSTSPERRISTTKSPFSSVVERATRKKPLTEVSAMARSLVQSRQGATSLFFDVSLLFFYLIISIVSAKPQQSKNKGKPRITFCVLVYPPFLARPSTKDSQSHQTHHDEKNNSGIRVKMVKSTSGMSYRQER
jgi:hypothetical protein